MTDTSSRRRQRLTMGLCGEDHAELYRSNMTFKGCVDALAGMLPFMIDGLAAQAAIEGEAQAVATAQMMRDMMTRPTTMVPTVDGWQPASPLVDRPVTPLTDRIFRDDPPLEDGNAEEDEVLDLLVNATGLPRTDIMQVLDAIAEAQNLMVVTAGT